jgi:hypothetical protein
MKKSFYVLNIFNTFNNRIIMQHFEYKFNNINIILNYIILYINE